MIRRSQLDNYCAKYIVQIHSVDISVIRTKCSLDDIVECEIETKINCEKGLINSTTKMIYSITTIILFAMFWNSSILHSFSISDISRDVIRVIAVIRNLWQTVFFSHVIDVHHWNVVSEKPVIFALLLWYDCCLFCWECSKCVHRSMLRGRVMIVSIFPDIYIHIYCFVNSIMLIHIS